MFRDQAEPPVKKINNFFDYTWALVNTLIEAQQSAHLHSDDWARTVYIDTIGVGTTDFDITNAKKDALVASGKACAEEYFKWYDDPSPKPNK